MDYTEMDITPMIVMGLQDTNDGLELGTVIVEHVQLFCLANGVDYT